jgi:hypothetical protein
MALLSLYKCLNEWAGFDAAPGITSAIGPESYIYLHNRFKDAIYEFYPQE